MDEKIAVFLVKMNFMKGLCARPPSPSFPILSFQGLWPLGVDPLNFSLVFSLACLMAGASRLSGIAAFRFLGPFGPLEPVRFCRAAFIPRRSSKLKFAEEVTSPVERGTSNSTRIGLSIFVEDGVRSSSDSFLCSSSSLLSLVASPPPLFSCTSSSSA